MVAAPVAAVNPGFQLRKVMVLEFKPARWESDGQFLPDSFFEDVGSEKAMWILDRLFSTPPCDVLVAPLLVSAAE